MLHHSDSRDYVSKFACVLYSRTGCKQPQSVAFRRQRPQPRRILGLLLVKSLQLSKIPLFAGMAVAAAVLAGCVTPPERVEVAELPQGAPTVSAILTDLQQSDNEIRDFRGAVTYELYSPLLNGRQRFRGSVKFRRPYDLYVEGNHHITRIPIFKLMCVGEEFLMEFPGNRDENFYQIEGNQYEDVPFSVSPSLIAQEMFFPEQWNTLLDRNVRLVGYEALSGIATLHINESNTLRRQITVRRVDLDAPRWVMIRNDRYNETGALIAETTLKGYATRDGVVFPTFVDARFPTEETRMTMEMRNIRPNTDLPDEDFDIRDRARELRLL